MKLTFSHARLTAQRLHAAALSCLSTPRTAQFVAVAASSRTRLPSR
jgi:hypothetical protein